jgi:hypothetical protein
MKKIKCKYCNKRIEAHTEKQAEYLLKQHLLSKHPDKVKFNGKD